VLITGISKSGFVGGLGVLAGPGKYYLDGFSPGVVPSMQGLSIRENLKRL
jgi:hypothetical protein